MAKDYRPILRVAAGVAVAVGALASPLAAQQYPSLAAIEVRQGFAYLVDDQPRATSWVADINLGRIGESNFTPVIGAGYWHTNRLGLLKAGSGHLGLRYEPFYGSRLTPFLQGKVIGQDMNAKGGGPARDKEWSGFTMGAGLGAGLSLGIDKEKHFRLMIEGERVAIKQFGHWGLRGGFSISRAAPAPVVAVAPVPSAADAEKLRLAEKAAADARSAVSSAESKARQAEGRATAAERDLQAALADLGRLMKDVVSISETSRGVVITLGKGLFGFDKSSLSPRATDEVERIAAVLKHFPSNRILVEGHTDSTGPEKYNQGLSERRAKTVAKALDAAGISQSRMELKGFGLGQPVADNAKASGRAENRRVEVVIVGAKLPGSK